LEYQALAFGEQDAMTQRDKKNTTAASLHNPFAPFFLRALLAAGKP
jgi:hypothetical protein